MTSYAYADRDEPLFAVIADGTPWMDPDGLTAWPERDAAALTAHVESLGYAVRIEEA